jgi:Flp pilus assembly pilin Flp
VVGLPGRSLNDDRGGAVVEYLILVGVVALLAIHAFTVFGTDTSTVVHAEGANVAKLGF